MDFRNNSLIDMINSYTSNYIKQIDYYKRYIEHLKNYIKYQTINIKYYNQLKEQFNDLITRHTELKQNYVEVERENARLQKQNMELIKEVEQYFKTSNKQINMVSPTQQQIDKLDNYIDPNYFQNFQYESSDDDSVNSKCRHILNLDLLSKQSKASQIKNEKLDSLAIPNQPFTSVQTSNNNDVDNGNLDVEIMKKLIGQDLMNELEKSITDFEEKDKTIEQKQTTNPFNSQFIIPNTVPNNNMFIFHSNTKPTSQTQTKHRIKKHRIHKYPHNNTSCSQTENAGQLDLLLNSLINLTSK